MRASWTSSSRASGASPGCSPRRGPSTRPSVSSTTGPKGAASTKSRPGEPGERFDDWVARVGTPWDDGYDVIYQMPFVHDGMRGIADFLVRVDGPSGGACSYEPVDAKLARVEAKPGHVLQLCFYADALRAATGAAPERLHLWLGSGRSSRSSPEEFHPYWSRLRSQLRQLLEDDGAHAGRPSRNRVPTASSASSPPCVTPNGATRTRSSTSPASGRATASVSRTRPSRRSPVWRSVSATWPRCAPSDSSGWSPRQGSRSRRGPTPTTRPRSVLIEAGADPTWGRGSSCSRSPTTGTSSWTSKATRSGRRTAACSSCSGSSHGMPTASGHTRPDGPTTAPRRSRRRGSSSSTWRTAGPPTRTCTSTTTTTRSDRRSSAWPPITASARRCCPRWWPRDSSSTSIRWSATPSRSAPSPTD